MAAKGELHALDTASGGLFGLSQLKKRENYSSKFPSVKKKTYIAIVKQALLPVWEDRNISNNGMPIIKINSEFICLKLISFIEIKHYTH